MFNLLRMDMRRLFRSRSFYIILGVTAALLVLMTVMVSAVSAPEKMDALQSTGVVVIDGSSEGLREELQGMTQLDFVHECLGSGFLLMLICIGVTLLVHTDFTSGYIKNICFAHPRRREYVLSKVLVAGAYSGIVITLGVLLSLGCPILFGIHPVTSPLVDILRYTFWLWLPHWAFGLMGLALVLLARSSTLGIIMAVLSGGGLVAVLLQSLCQRFGWHNLAQYMLNMVVCDQCAPMPDMGRMAMILACTAGWGLVYTAGSLLMLEKRDI